MDKRITFHVNFSAGLIQGCLAVNFQAEKSHFGYILEGLAWKMLEYFVAVCNIWQPFGIHMYLMAIWYNLWSYGVFFTFWYVAPRKTWQPCKNDSSAVKGAIA
jgi:hypothetical protein